MIQEIIVAIIGIAVLVVLGRHIYKFFCDDNRGACGCSSCHCNVTKTDKRT